jgi:hypothetical protein
MQIGKEEVKLFLLANDMISYLKRPKTLLDIINSFSKVANPKSIYNNWENFHTPTLNRI